MQAFKIVALLLTGLGLAGVTCHLATGKCPLGHLKAAAKRAWAGLHEQEPHDKVIEVQADAEPVQLLREAQVREAEAQRGGEQWQHLVAARRRAGQCHMRCGEDKECHSKCPRPWEHFKSKCELVNPILSCHKSCGGLPSCHAQCPKPECPRMRAMVDRALECQGACKPGDLGCARACPLPLLRMEWGCSKLAIKADCHKACGLHDWECHHQCHHKHFGGHHGHHFGHHHGHHFGHHHGHHHGRHEPQWQEAKASEEGPLAVAEAVDPTFFQPAEAAVVQV